MDSPLTTLRTGRRVLLGAAAALAARARWRGASARATTTVRFAFFGTDVEQQAYRRLIDAFQAEHPGIVVEAVGKASGDPSLATGARPQGSRYQPWLETAFSDAQAPDVFLISYQRFRAFVARGLVEPLGPYLAASSVLRAEDFYPAALDAFRHEDLPDDGLGGLPQNASSLAVYYNPDAFEAFGVPLPTDGWTWDEFAAAATRMTGDIDGDGRVGFYGLVAEPTISRWAAFVWGAGGELGDDPDRPTQFALDTPNALDGLRWFASLGPAGAGAVPPEAEAREVPDLLRFCRRGAAMLIHSRRVVPTLREVADLRWDVAPLPVGAVPANVLHSDAFCLAASSTNKDAAWEFIQFAAGPAGQAVLAATGRTVPSLRAVAESGVFLKGTELGLLQLPPHNGRVFLDNIPIARRLPPLAAMPAVEASFGQAFRRAFYVDGDVAAAATRVARDIRGPLGPFLSPSSPSTGGRRYFAGEVSETEE
jgi:multiple sugar transport system substrate-binding protein